MERLKTAYWFTFLPMFFLSVIVISVRLGANLPDLVSRTNFMVFLAPLVLILGILIPYFSYSLAVKKTQDSDLQIKFKTFVNKQILKYICYSLITLFYDVLIFIHYNTEYLFSLGILLIFFLLDFPSDYKFRRDFLKEFEHKENVN